MIMERTQPLQKKRFDDVYLRPSDRLGFGEHWEEFEVKKWPAKLLDVVSLLGSRKMRARCIWFGEGVVLHHGHDWRLDPLFARKGYSSGFSFGGSCYYDTTAGGKHFGFTVRSKTLEASTAFLNWIVALPDSSLLNDVEIQRWGQGTQILLLSVERLARICVPSPATGRRKSLHFVKTRFSANQSRVLASCNFKSLELAECTFLDGGAAFLENCVMAQDQPTELRMSDRLPFEDGIWKEFASLLSGKWTLSLTEIDFSCGNLPTPAPDVDCLKVSGCQYSDNLAPLTAAVGSNRGPREILIDIYGYEGKEDEIEDGIQRFFQALTTNSRTEKLSLGTGFCMASLVESLADTLRTNGKLRELKMNYDGEMTTDSWEVLFAAISVNVSLLRIAFDSFHFDEDEQECPRLAIKNLVLMNRQIEEIKMGDGGPYEDDFWAKDIEPRLEVNRFRKRFDRINLESSNSLRAGLLGRALGRVAAKPSLIWLALQLNQGTVVMGIQGG